MSHSQRLIELIQSEELNKSKFSKSIKYTLKNLTNYLNGVTAYPNGELVIGILRHYPHWNIRYWLLGEGKPLLNGEELKVVEEAIHDYSSADPVIRELMEQLAYMRKENQLKAEEIKKLKKE